MRYEYSTVRYVPDAARAEFVTVALVVAGEDGWTVRPCLEKSRASKLHNGSKYFGGAREFVRQLERRAASESNHPTLSGEDWLKELAAQHRQIVQLSAPAPAVGVSLEAVADDLSAELLTFVERRQSPVTRNTAYNALRKSLFAVTESFGDEITLRERCELVASDQHVHMDFAVQNGAVHQLSHAFAFTGSEETLRTVDTQVKAWAWVVDTLKEKGGQIRFADGGRAEIASDIDVEVYVLPPSQGSEQYEQSLHTFDRLEIAVADSPEQIAERARELVAGNR